MITIIYMAVLFISILLALNSSLLSGGIVGHCGALPKFSILFLLYSKDIKVLAGFLFIWIQQSAVIVAINRVYRSANHYVISLDILVLFSLLLLIRYHILKIADSPSVR